ncbi:hypothetical protein NUU61_007732 [Penicillium alfredii]|uniref:Xylanolytic transcriptional activator regulatory domain-containing protein n=1 Tax=Penicillium alfredii TaxID=1506179 RepID=A0A9W9ERA2_9EURO|nr:uncharacterized protein NUU61_007732 [Penicillium alfredii]KAJ5086425.1 hypothetical protein NUU61_007732 [Penicillium alfredii]
MPSASVRNRHHLVEKPLTRPQDKVLSSPPPSILSRDVIPNSSRLPARPRILNPNPNSLLRLAIAQHTGTNNSERLSPTNKALLHSFLIRVRDPSQSSVHRQHHNGDIAPEAGYARGAARDEARAATWFIPMKSLLIFYVQLDRLKMNAQSLPHGHSDTSDDETPSTKTPSTQELGRTPSARHAFLFRHNLSPATPDLCDLHPLPSQIPFLLDVFGENVNVFAQVVHLPTVKKMVRDLCSNVASLTPAIEALMFAIYYVAITSMEEDDVLLNFGSTKTELNLKYRLGLEYALAKADFLNVPNLVLLQGFIIFLLLVRRHDSPRFVWMMTGLAIRMGQALGLHRNGSNFVHLTPFEVEMRRRVCFDTKMPLNINDADISPDSKQMPQERSGLTDMSFSRVWMGVCDVTKQMIAHNIQDQPPSLEEQSCLLNEIYQGLEKGFLQYSTESGNIAYWVSVTVARLVMAKLSLLIYLPVLFSSPSEQLSKELRTKLLVSAIEAAEYNHALNAENACRHWRWLFQTYTHWYAVVYIHLEISRRPWSPLVERAWVALHSAWLIPNQSNLEKNLRIWFPLRKLMAKSRKHQLVSEERNIQQPLSSGPYATASDATYYFPELWCNLLGRISGSGGLAGTSEQPATNIPHSMPSLPYVGAGGRQPGHNPSRTSSTEFGTAVTTCSPNLLVPNRTLPRTNNSSFAGPRYQPDDQASGPGLVPWLWADEDPSVGMPADVAADVDFNMDLDGDVDWYNWVDSAKGIEWE